MHALNRLRMSNIKCIRRVVQLLGMKNYDKKNHKGIFLSKFPSNRIGNIHCKHCNRMRITMIKADKYFKLF